MPTNNIQSKYTDVLQKFNNFLSDAKEYRSTWEIRSFVDESFYEWNHRVVFDNISKQLVNLPITSDNMYQIWKIRKIVRGVRNMILKNDPRWHPRSARQQPVKQEEITIASAILQSIYKEDHIKDKLKDLLTHSLTKTLSWAYIWYDWVKDDIDIFVEDPYNIYTSPDGRLEWPVFVWKYIIRTIRKSLDDVKNSEIYKNWKFKKDLKNIQAERKMAESDYKNTILESEYKIPVDENWSVIVQELYIMDNEIWTDITDNKSPEEDQIYHNNWNKVRIITRVWDIIIRDELTEYDTFPFIAYQPERNKWLLYSNSWISPLIQLNKALDEWYSNRADWLEKFAKWRIMMQKGNKMSVIKWRNWQVIEYTWTKPTPMETWNLPQEVNIHMNETERMMEDIWWIHSESTWRLSWTALSWVAIAQLQASDNNNVSEPVDNLKTFLEELAYRILDLASKHYWPRQQTLENWEKVMIIWEWFKMEVEKITWQPISEDYIKIKPIKNIEVEIIPWSAFSDLQSRQDLVELRWLWVAIPDKLIIDAYKLWDTATIIEQYQEEQEEKEERQDWEDWLESKQAQLENDKLMNWIQIVPQNWENHEIHLAIHWALLKKIWQWSQSQLLMQHMQQHEALMNNWQQLQQQSWTQQNTQQQQQNIWQI